MYIPVSLQTKLKTNNTHLTPNQVTQLIYQKKKSSSYEAFYQQFTVSQSLTLARKTSVIKSQDSELWKITKEHYINIHNTTKAIKYNSKPLRISCATNKFDNCFGVASILKTIITN